MHAPVTINQGLASLLEEERPRLEVSWLLPWDSEVLELVPELLLELSLRGHLTSVFVNPILRPIVSSLVEGLCPQYGVICEV